jgi:hypothetical protein
MGNPCTEWSGYRPYVIAKLPQLKRLVRAAAGGVRAAMLDAGHDQKSKWDRFRKGRDESVQQPCVRC